MILTPGQRLTSGTRDAYQVIEPAWETSRHVFYRASKVFWNLHFADKRLAESAEDECLRVLVRCPVDDPDPGRLRADLQFELEKVLRMPDACWFPEPLDVLDVPADLVLIPLLVLAEPHGARLSDESNGGAHPGRIVRFSRELLTMLDHLHRQRLVRGALDPADVFLDGMGRWFDLGTDRIALAESEESFRSDLIHWARFCQRIVGGRDPAPEFPETDDDRWLADRIGRCLAPTSAEPPISAAALLGQSRRSERPPASSRETLGKRLRRIWERRVDSGE